jgi:hypothetical protein
VSAVLSREQNRGTLAAPKAEDFIAELQALRISADAESAARFSATCTAWPLTG